MCIKDYILLFMFQRKMAIIETTFYLLLTSEDDPGDNEMLSQITFYDRHGQRK